MINRTGICFMLINLVAILIMVNYEIEPSDLLLFIDTGLAFSIGKCILDLIWEVKA